MIKRIYWHNLKTIDAKEELFPWGKFLQSGTCVALNDFNYETNMIILASDISSD